MSSYIIIHNTNFKEVYTTNEVAKNYQVTENTVRDHLNNHDDEFIENTHYFYTINPRFKTKILNWTLEGVYMLGFFIKSEQAKNYRKKVAEFLRLCDEARQKKFNEARATITEQMDEIANLKAIATSKDKNYNDQINSYKSLILQKNDEILYLKKKILKENEKKNEQNEEAVILLGQTNEKIRKISEAYIEIQSIMAYLCGDDYFIKEHFYKKN